MRVCSSIIALLLLLSMVVPITLTSCESEQPSIEPVPEKILISTPTTYPDIQYEPFIIKAHAEHYKTTVLTCIDDLDAKCLSGDYTEEAELIMADEELRLWEIIHKIDADIDKFNTWEEEYYYAAMTWQSLRELGYSETVAAAIIGNMMVETAGGTLNLKPHIYSSGKSFYGLCQWSLYYRPNVAGMQFEDQIIYLYNDMEKEFENFGFCYKKNFTYEDFLIMEDVGDAAVAFAKVYERCSGHYDYRATCAEKAYEYFTGEV